MPVRTNDANFGLIIIAYNYLGNPGYAHGYAPASQSHDNERRVQNQNKPLAKAS